MEYRQSIQNARKRAESHGNLQKVLNYDSNVQVSEKVVTLFEWYMCHSPSNKQEATPADWEKFADDVEGLTPEDFGEGVEDVPLEAATPFPDKVLAALDELHNEYGYRYGETDSRYECYREIGKLIMEHPCAMALQDSNGVSERVRALYKWWWPDTWKIKTSRPVSELRWFVDELRILTIDDFTGNEDDDEDRACLAELETEMDNWREDEEHFFVAKTNALIGRIEALDAEKKSKPKATPSPNVQIPEPLPAPVEEVPSAEPAPSTPNDLSALLNRLAEISAVADAEGFTTEVEDEFEAIGLVLAGMDVDASLRKAEMIVSNANFQLAHQRHDLMRLHAAYKAGDIHLNTDKAEAVVFFEAPTYDRDLAQAVAKLNWTRQHRVKVFGISKHLSKQMMKYYRSEELEMRNKWKQRYKANLRKQKMTERANREMLTERTAKAVDVRESVRAHLKRNPPKNRIEIDPVQCANVWLACENVGGKSKLSKAVANYNELFGFVTGPLSESQFRKRLRLIDFATVSGNDVGVKK